MKWSVFGLLHTYISFHFIRLCLHTRTDAYHNGHSQALPYGEPVDLYGVLETFSVVDFAQRAQHGVP